jgi:PAS domain S-box-containing protein
MMNNSTLSEEIRKLIDGFPLAIIVVDGDFRIIYWNRGAVDVFGWERDEVLNKYLDDLVDKEVIKQERQVRHFPRKDGSMVLCECYTSSFEDVFILTCRDITREFEEGRELESYRQFFERAQDVFFRVGRVDVNQKFASILGYAKNEIVELQHPFLSLVHPEDHQKVREEFLRVLRGETRRYEVRMKSKNGDIVWFEVIAWPWKEGGVTFGCEGILRDITERKREEERIKVLNERLDVLKAILRHDLSSHLSAIGNYVELLEGEPNNKEYLSKIRDITIKSLELIRDVRIAEDAEKRGKITKAVDLSKILSKEVKVITSPNVEVKVEVPEEIYVEADNMLNSVFSNILQNAVFHTDKELKKIEVTARELREDDVEWVEVRIADNGPGIPDDMKEEVFREGVKGERTGRTGLGLFLVKTLVEKYGGKVWIEDNEPEGSVFILKFRKGRKE